MAYFHLRGDTAGDTHLEVLVFPFRESPAGTVRGLHDIPVTTAGFGEFLGRKPDVGLHTAPRRQLLVVLQGALEIETTLGARERLVPGDILLADDIGTKGHISRDVGDQPLMLMAVAIADEWQGPPGPGK